MIAHAGDRSIRARNVRVHRSAVMLSPPSSVLARSRYRQRDVNLQYFIFVSAHVRCSLSSRKLQGGDSIATDT